MSMQQQTFPWLKQVSHAVLSEDRVYRYVLYRSLDGEAWDAEGERRTICFVMLNPSTADENANDPTIEKLMKFGRAWGFGRLAVVNLFAYRETDSKKLRSMAAMRDLVGPENDSYILRVTNESQKIVCAWGKEGDIQDRGAEVTLMLDFRPARRPLWCFKKNQDGSPVHPLYQRDAAELIEFR
jgi:hypothetical protein